MAKLLYELVCHPITNYVTQGITVFCVSPKTGQYTASHRNFIQWKHVSEFFSHFLTLLVFNPKFRLVLLNNCYVLFVYVCPISFWLSEWPTEWKTTRLNRWALIFKNHSILTRVAPYIRPFLISGIRPYIRFRLPDIRLVYSLLKT